MCGVDHNLVTPGSCNWMIWTLWLLAVVNVHGWGCKTTADGLHRLSVLATEAPACRRTTDWATVKASNHRWLSTNADTRRFFRPCIIMTLWQVSADRANKLALVSVSCCRVTLTASLPEQAGRLWGLGQQVAPILLVSVQIPQQSGQEASCCCLARETMSSSAVGCCYQSAFTR